MHDREIGLKTKRNNAGDARPRITIYIVKKKKDRVVIKNTKTGMVRIVPMKD